MYRTVYVVEESLKSSSTLVYAFRFLLLLKRPILGRIIIVRKKTHNIYNTIACYYNHMLSLLVGTAVYASFPSPLKFPLLCAFGVVGKRLKKKTTKKTSERDDDNDAINSPIAMLRWSRVGLLSVRKKKKTTVQILENVSGEAMPGRVLAIVGPSGAGKTSLLNALAKRVPKKGAELTGRIFVVGSIGVGVATKKKKKKKY